MEFVDWTPMEFFFSILGSDMSFLYVYIYSISQRQYFLGFMTVSLEE